MIKKIMFLLGTAIVMGCYFDLMYIHFYSATNNLYETTIQSNNYGEFWIEAVMMVVGLICFIGGVFLPALKTYKKPDTI